MTIKLAAFDLDGTLLRGDTVCELVARRLDRYERMQEIERITDLAAIKRAREEMAEWYAGIAGETLCSYLDDALIASGSDEGLHILRTHGIALALVSVTWDFAVDHFARRFGIEHVTCTRRNTVGIQHVWPEDKTTSVASLAARLGLRREEVAAVGDSWGDVPMFTFAGLPIFVGDRLPATLPHACHMPAASIADVARVIVDAS